MKRAVRAIVVRSDQILVMKRNKFGQEYYTLVGGRVEMQESPEQALVRELAEETTMSAQSARLVYIEKAGDPYGDQYVYLCDGVEGEPVLSPESEEASINKLGQNIYEPMWLPINKLSEVPFKSETLKRKLIRNLSEGFGETVETFDPNDFHA